MINLLKLFAMAESYLELIFSCVGNRVSIFIGVFHVNYLVLHLEKMSYVLFLTNSLSTYRLKVLEILKVEPTRCESN
jgi:hypothetical protein